MFVRMTVCLLNLHQSTLGLPVTPAAFRTPLGFTGIDLRGHGFSVLWSGVAEDNFVARGLDELNQHPADPAVLAVEEELLLFSIGRHVVDGTCAEIRPNLHAVSL